MFSIVTPLLMNQTQRKEVLKHNRITAYLDQTEPDDEKQLNWREGEWAGRLKAIILNDKQAVENNPGCSRDYGYWHNSKSLKIPKPSSGMDIPVVTTIKQEPVEPNPKLICWY